VERFEKNGSEKRDKANMRKLVKYCYPESALKEIMRFYTGLFCIPTKLWFSQKGAKTNSNNEKLEQKRKMWAFLSCPARSISVTISIAVGIIAALIGRVWLWSSCVNWSLWSLIGRSIVGLIAR
jgi:hypothetical protein